MDKKTGIIKWYSNKNEYGFITDSSNNDVFFKKENISESKDLIDAEKDLKHLIPSIGDKVEYIESISKKGEKRGKNICIIQRSEPIFICPHCKKQSNKKYLSDQNNTVTILCENCLKTINSYSSLSYKIEKHNRTAILLFILFLVCILLLL